MPVYVVLNKYPNTTLAILTKPTFFGREIIGREPKD